jgi:flagellar hook-length control protein FliK
MSLKPESLGEITVKLTEEAGKSVLTITTASAATAKLLNSDLDALKAAMAPLNVRVNEAVTQTAAPQQSGSQLFDMAGQQFAGQQQQQQFAQQFAARQNGSYNSAGRQTGDETLYTAQAAADSTARTYVGNGLNAYV